MSNPIQSVKSTERNNYIPKTPVNIACSIEATLHVIGGKWSFLVLRELFGGKKRFGELWRGKHFRLFRLLWNTILHPRVKIYIPYLKK